MTKIDTMATVRAIEKAGGKMNQRSLNARAPWENVYRDDASALASLAFAVQSGNQESIRSAMGALSTEAREAIPADVWKNVRSLAEVKTLTPEVIATHVAARRSRGVCSYPVILVYVREHTTGVLAGITSIDTLPFCYESDATEWVEKINARNARGDLEYRVPEFGTQTDATLLAEQAAWLKRWEADHSTPA